MEQSGGKILVVDDERMNVLVLRGILSQAGFTVSSAMNGKEALDLARAEKPGMILLDIMMPGESGFDICTQLKADPVTACIPVIFVTCLADVDSKLTGLDMGAVDYITKPFFAPEVVARVRSHMNFTRLQSCLINEQASRLSQVQVAQQAMLVKPEDAPDARFAVHYVPVLEAGGDFYDVVDFGGGSVGYFVADVSGHDLGASFVTSSLKALFRQHAAPNRPPSATLAAMNRILCAITPEETYFTAIHLHLDRPSGTFAVSTAGHPPLVFAQGEQARFLELSGSPLGLFQEVEFACHEGVVQPGERFYLYTDGLANGMPGRSVMASAFRERLVQLALEARAVPLGAAVSQIAAELVGLAAPEDDVVLLGVEA